MSKLSSLSKVDTYLPGFVEEHAEPFMRGFESGFEIAFKVIKEELNNEIKRASEYPMMGERVFALKTYIKKMDQLLEEMKSNEY